MRNNKTSVAVGIRRAVERLKRVTGSVFEKRGKGKRGKERGKGGKGKNWEKRGVEVRRAGRGLKMNGCLIKYEMVGRKGNFAPVLLKNGYFTSSVFISFHIFGHEFVTPYTSKHFMLDGHCVLLPGFGTAGKESLVGNDRQGVWRLFQ